MTNGTSKFFGGVGSQEPRWARLAWRGSWQRMNAGMQAFANTVSSCIPGRNTPSMFTSFKTTGQYDRRGPPHTKELLNNYSDNKRRLQTTLACYKDDFKN
jgi:hypothetical protein